MAKERGGDTNETPLPNGCTLFRVANGVGGHMYLTDEVGGGCQVWDTCLVDRSTMLAAIVEESRREMVEYVREERAGRSKWQLQLLVVELFRAISPKLGGGGITAEQRDRLRQLSLPHLTPDERRVCGLDDE